MALRQFAPIKLRGEILMEITLFDFVLHVMEEIDKQRIRLKDQISQAVESTDRGKQQARLEQWIYDFLKQEVMESLKSMNAGVRLNAEGYEPVENGLPVEQVINIDPWDGTANGCRFIDGGQQIGSSFATVISVMPEMENTTFGDV